MTVRTNARLAGCMFLLYIATGITHMILSNRAGGGDEGIAETLASIAQHAPLVRMSVVLALVMAICALVLAVALYALTREVDPELAMLALLFRFAEGVIIALSPVWTLTLLSVATGAAGAAAQDAATASVHGALLLKVEGMGTIAAICFALGSTLYSYLFLRGRTIPLPLAWLGLLASLVWVVAFPLQLVRLLPATAAYFTWIPMLVFEVGLALWLIIKGTAPPATR